MVKIIQNILYTLYSKNLPPISKLRKKKINSSGLLYIKKERPHTRNNLMCTAFFYHHKYTLIRARSCDLALFLFLGILFGFPLSECSFPFFRFVKGNQVWKQTPGQFLDDVIRNF